MATAICVIIGNQAEARGWDYTYLSKWLRQHAYLCANNCHMEITIVEAEQMLYYLKVSIYLVEVIFKWSSMF